MPLTGRQQAALYHSRRRRWLLQWSPAHLFVGETGLFLDDRDPGVFWADTARTTPAGVGDPVASWEDKSGNGNHAVQATAASQPILRQYPDGRYYLESDAVDDGLKALFTIAQPWDRISAIEQIGWTNGKRIFSGGNVNAGELFQNSATPQLALYAGSAIACGNTGATIGSRVVATERFAGADSRLAINDGAYSTGNPGTTAPGGITILNYQAGGGGANARCGGILMIGRALTDAEITRARAYFAQG